jgi:hypothetical protein
MFPGNSKAYPKEHLSIVGSNIGLAGKNLLWSALKISWSVFTWQAFPAKSNICEQDQPKSTTFLR